MPDQKPWEKDYTPQEPVKPWEKSYSDDPVKKKDSDGLGALQSISPPGLEDYEAPPSTHDLVKRDPLRGFSDMVSSAGVSEVKKPPTEPPIAVPERNIPAKEKAEKREIDDLRGIDQSTPEGINHINLSVGIVEAERLVSDQSKKIATLMGQGIYPITDQTLWQHDSSDRLAYLEDQKTLTNLIDQKDNLTTLKKENANKITQGLVQDLIPIILDEDGNVKGDLITVSVDGIPTVNVKRVDEIAKSKFSDEGLVANYKKNLGERIEYHLTVPQKKITKYTEENFLKESGKSLKDAISKDAFDQFNSVYETRIASANNHIKKFTTDIDAELKTQEKELMDGLLKDAEGVKVEAQKIVDRIQNGGGTQEDLDRAVQEYNSKITARYDEANDAIHSIHRWRNNTLQKEIEAHNKIIDSWNKEFSTTYNLSDEIKGHLKKATEDASDRAFSESLAAKRGMMINMGGQNALLRRLGTSTLSSLGGAMSGWATSLGGDGIVGDQMAAYFQPSVTNMESFKDITMFGLIEAGGNILGSMSPSILAGGTVALLTKNSSLASRMFTTGMAGWAAETTDMTGRAYKEALAESGSMETAKKAASEMFDAQEMLIPLYFTEGLPFLGAFKYIKNPVLRVGIGGAVSYATELSQEYPQNLAEESIRKTGEYENWDDELSWKSLEKTAVNLLPMVGQGGIGAIASSEKSLKGKLPPDAGLQQIVNLSYDKGVHAAKLQIHSLYAQGLIDGESLNILGKYIENIDLKESKSYQILQIKKDLYSRAAANETDPIKSKKINSIASSMNKAMAGILSGEATDVYSIEVDGQAYLYTEEEMPGLDPKVKDKLVKETKISREKELDQHIKGLEEIINDPEALPEAVESATEELEGIQNNIEKFKEEMSNLEVTKSTQETEKPVTKSTQVNETKAVTQDVASEKPTPSTTESVADSKQKEKKQAKAPVKSTEPAKPVKAKKPKKEKPVDHNAKIREVEGRLTDLALKIQAKILGKELTDSASEAGTSIVQDYSKLFEEFDNRPVNKKGQTIDPVNERNAAKLMLEAFKGRMPKSVYDKLSKTDIANIRALSKVWGKLMAGKVSDRSIAASKTLFGKVVDARKKVKAGDTVESVIKSYEASGIKVETLSREEYDSKVEELNKKHRPNEDSSQGRGSGGVFDHNDGVIYFSEDSLNKPFTGQTLVYHEAIHPIINIIRNTNPALYKSLVRAINTMAKTHKGVKSVSSWVSDNYEGEVQQEDELIVELLARIASGRVKVMSLSIKVRQLLAKFFNAIAIILFPAVDVDGQKGFYWNGKNRMFKSGDIKRLNEFAKLVSKTLSEGKDISEIVGKENVGEFQADLGTQERAEDNIEHKIALTVEESVKSGSQLPAMIFPQHSGETNMKTLRDKKYQMYINRALDFSKTYLVKGKVRKYNKNATKEKKLEWADSVYARAKEVVLSNLLHIYDSIPNYVREISKLWYDGANKIAQDFANKYKISLEQAAAVIAALSPQKPWFDNLHIAHFIIDFNSKNQDTILTKDVYDFYKRTGVEYPKQVANLPALKKVIGKKYSDLNSYEKSIMIRYEFDTKYERRAPTRLPTGDIVGREKNLSSFGGYDKMAAAVNILIDGNLENISANIGKDSKVRNFYNNIVDPLSDKHVTIDTHAIAAGYHLPLGSSSPEVRFDFGTYAFFHDVYTEAANQRGVLPREMQSIVWEGVKSLFPKNKKTDKHKNKAKSLWEKYNKGVSSQEEIQKQIKEDGEDLSKTDWSGYINKDLIKKQGESHINELSLAGGDKSSDKQGGGGVTGSEVSSVGTADKEVDGKRVSNLQFSKGESIVGKKRKDLVKGTYYEQNLMETGDGTRYVFYHRTSADPNNLASGIDSRKFHSTKTDRLEKSSQYGVASYYTLPEDGERMVKGETYLVTVLKGKVYPMDTDPNGYEFMAERAVGKSATNRPAEIKKFIAELAKADGYEMAIGEWNYDRTGAKTEQPALRADALIPLKPKTKFTKPKVKAKRAATEDISHPDKENIEFKNKVVSFAEKVSEYLSDKGKYNDQYDLVEKIRVYDYIPTTEEFNELVKNLPETLTKDVSYLIEAQQPVKIDGAPEGHILNVGLEINGVDDLITQEQVEGFLPKGVKIIGSEAVYGTENTISLQVSRPLTTKEMTKLLADTQQDAIPMLSDGVGTMYGDLKGLNDYGKFNPDYFILPDGNPLKGKGGLQFSKDDDISDVVKAVKKGIKQGLTKKELIDAMVLAKIDIDVAEEAYKRATARKAKPPPKPPKSPKDKDDQKVSKFINRLLSYDGLTPQERIFLDKIKYYEEVSNEQANKLADTIVNVIEKDFGVNDLASGYKEILSGLDPYNDLIMREDIPPAITMVGLRLIDMSFGNPTMTQDAMEVATLVTKWAGASGRAVQAFTGKANPKTLFAQLLTEISNDIDESLGEAGKSELVKLEKLLDAMRVEVERLNNENKSLRGNIVSGAILSSKKIKPTLSLVDKKRIQSKLLKAKKGKAGGLQESKDEKPLTDKQHDEAIDFLLAWLDKPKNRSAIEAIEAYKNSALYSGLSVSQRAEVSGAIDGLMADEVAKEYEKIATDTQKEKIKQVVDLINKFYEGDGSFNGKTLSEALSDKLLSKKEAKKIQDDLNDAYAPALIELEKKVVGELAIDELDTIQEELDTVNEKLENEKLLEEDRKKLENEKKAKERAKNKAIEKSLPALQKDLDRLIKNKKAEIKRGATSKIKSINSDIAKRKKQIEKTRVAERNKAKKARLAGIKLGLSEHVENYSKVWNLTSMFLNNKKHSWDIKGLLSKKYGFREVDNATIIELNNLTNLITKYTDKDTKNLTALDPNLRRFNKLFRKLGPRNAHYYYQYVMSFTYLTTLSGFTTIPNAFFGGASAMAIEWLVNMAANGKAATNSFFETWFKKQDWEKIHSQELSRLGDMAKEAWGHGVSTHDELGSWIDMKSGGTNIGFESLNDMWSWMKKMTADKENKGDMIVGMLAGIGIVPAQMLRISGHLMFFDMMFIERFAKPHANVAAYKMAKADRDKALSDHRETMEAWGYGGKDLEGALGQLKKSRDLYESMQEILGENVREESKERAIREREQMVSEGINVGIGYVNKRTAELVEAENDERLMTTQRKLGKTALLMGEPQGTAGHIYRMVNKLIPRPNKTAKPSDAEIKIFNRAIKAGPMVDMLSALGYMLPKTLALFIRLTVNFTAMSIQYTPGIGLIDMGLSAKGIRVRNKKDIKDKGRIEGPEITKRLIRQAFSTMLLTVFLTQMFELEDWDDDDEELKGLEETFLNKQFINLFGTRYRLVIDPAAPFIITGNISGQYKDIVTAGDNEFKRYSIKFRTGIDKDGKGIYSSGLSYLNFPTFAPAMAMAGAIYDNYAFKTPRKQTPFWELLENATISSLMAPFQTSFSKTTRDITAMVFESTKEDPHLMREFGQRFVGTIAKTATYPPVFSHSIQGIKALAGNGDITDQNLTDWHGFWDYHYLHDAINSYDLPEIDEWGYKMGDNPYWIEKYRELYPTAISAMDKYREGKPIYEFIKAFGGLKTFSGITQPPVDYKADLQDKYNEHNIYLNFHPLSTPERQLVEYKSKVDFRKGMDFIWDKYKLGDVDLKSLPTAQLDGMRKKINESISKIKSTNQALYQLFYQEMKIKYGQDDVPVGHYKDFLDYTGVDKELTGEVLDSFKALDLNEVLKRRKEIDR